jgi:hypothetical protein
MIGTLKKHFRVSYKYSKEKLGGEIVLKSLKRKTEVK